MFFAEIKDLLDKEKVQTDAYASDLSDMRSKLSEFRAPVETSHTDIKYSAETLADGTSISVQHLKVYYFLLNILVY